MRNELVIFLMMLLCIVAPISSKWRINTQTTGPWTWNLLQYALPLVIALLLVWVLYEDEASNLKRKLDLKQAHFASGGTSDKVHDMYSCMHS